jgi:parvulin-like peptidyl-prolyl isomerase
MNETPQEPTVEPKPLETKPTTPAIASADTTGKALQKTKRMMMIAVSVIILLIILMLLGGGYWLVYVNNSTASAVTAVKNVLPLPAGRVNGEFVSLKTYEKRVAATQNFYKKQEELQLGLTEQTPTAAEIKQQEFDRLVEESVVNTYAKEQGVAVTDQDVNDYFDKSILPQAKGGMEEVNTTLKDLYNWSVDDFKREVLREAVLRNKLQEKLSKDDAQNSAAKEKITTLYTEIKDGKKSFEDAAKESSDDTVSAEQGGVLGTITKGQTVKEFEEKAFSAPIGELTEPFVTQYGWHILKVSKRDDAAGTADVQHILVMTKQLDDVIQEKVDAATVSPFVSGIE